MAEYRQEHIEADEPQQKGRVPSWVRGLLAGEFFLGIAWFGAFLFQKSTPLLSEWFLDLEFTEILRFMCLSLAQPVSVVGWFLIWGDNGPPFRWIGSIAFNVAFGLVFYGLIGALVGRWIGKLRHR